MEAGRGEKVGGGEPADVLKRKRRERMITEKQYAEILDAIDKAKQELLLKLTEIMNAPEPYAPTQSNNSKALDALGKVEEL